MTQTRNLVGIIGEGVSALVVFGMIGCGIGYFQAMVAFRSMDASLWGCTVGVPAGVIIGGILWFVPLHRHLSFSFLSKVVTVVFGTALISASLFGWPSVFVSPLALIISTLVFRGRPDGIVQAASK